MACEITGALTQCKNKLAKDVLKTSWCLITFQLKNAVN